MILSVLKIGHLCSSKTLSERRRLLHGMVRTALYEDAHILLTRAVSGAVWSSIQRTTSALLVHKHLDDCGIRALLSPS